MAKQSLNEQAREILRIAEETGVQTNFFFATTFKRYQVQLNNLTDLESAIRETGTLVTKEYVKGRANIYVNPAVTEYNKTTDSANRTVTTLMKIIKGFAKEDEERDSGYDPLMAIINGEDNDGE
jgi:tRNA(Phe) wybutosine-synthesizing methylase Tyw3|nr:MAG TPA: terminase small subunit [Caudoviricetes sp.]